MAALPPRTIMMGHPPTPGHKPSKSDLADWMQEVESLAVGGGLSYVNATLAALDARVGVVDQQFALVLSTAEEAGVYERVAGVWSKVAGVPAIFVENQAAAQILAARDEVATAALAVALNASTALAAAEASGLAAFFDTKALADAGLAGLAEGQLIEVLSDETQGGRRARYRVEAGDLVFKLAIGGMQADQNLADLADKDAALGILGVTLTGKELVKATTAAAMRAVLKLKSGALATKASQALAETGTDNVAFMTPLATKHAVAAQVPGLITPPGWEPWNGIDSLIYEYSDGDTFDTIELGVFAGGYDYQVEAYMLGDVWARNATLEILPEGEVTWRPSGGYLQCGPARASYCRYNFAAPKVARNIHLISHEAVASWVHAPSQSLNSYANFHAGDLFSMGAGAADVKNGIQKVRLKLSAGHFAKAAAAGPSGEFAKTEIRMWRQRRAYA